MDKKVTFAENIFAKLFNIVAGKDYLVAFQWNGCKASKFFPLNSHCRNLSLLILGLLSLGLLALTCEMTSWTYRKLALEYHHKTNLSLKSELKDVVAEQKSLESALDSLGHIEEKIRALYGMNTYGKNVKAFGIGGRRLESENDQMVPAIADQMLNSTLKNRQLENKISFTSSSFKQIEEFVKYRHNLWEHTPFVLPAKGQFTSGFGYRLNPVTRINALHEGMDIANSRWTPIYATADGIVSTSSNSGNFGNLIVIDHGNGYQTKYGHLSKIMVEKGQLVKRYTLIGYMGDSGRATGIHLHYEVHRDGNAQNPEKYILPSGVLVD